MLNIDSKKWTLVFLFYGFVCFGFGLLGCLSNRENRTSFHKEPALARVKHPDLLARTEKYLTGRLADLMMRNSQDTVIPAFSNSSTGRLIFCYPERTELPLFQLFIKTAKSVFTKHFPLSGDIPITGDTQWESSLVHIWEAEPQSVIIGVNVSGSQSAPVNIHLYVSVPDNCRETFLPALEKCCRKLNQFSFSKRRFNDRDLFRVTWEENQGQLIKNLEWIINDLTVILERQGIRSDEPI